MHPPSRTRRILKWTGVGLSLLVATLWTVSIFKAVAHFGDGRSCVATGGHVFVFRSPRLNPSQSAYVLQSLDKCMRGSFGFSLPSASAIFNPDSITLPLWLPFVLTALPTAWLWHRDRRLISFSPDHPLCRGCGYDLTGNISGVCSECGFATSVNTTNPSNQPNSVKA